MLARRRSDTAKQASESRPYAFYGFCDLAQANHHGKSLTD